EHRAIYYTPLSRRLLEKFVLRHFHHFRVREDLSEELFDLPQEEADRFEAVVKAIEQHLLAIELLRLKAVLRARLRELHSDTQKPVKRSGKKPVKDKAPDRKP